MKIKIFITGGTIDGVDYETEDQAPNNPKSVIPHLLENSRVSYDYDVEVFCLKDSRFIDDAERNSLLNKCKECPEGNILITHGSLTMPITAKFLGKAKLQKTIILVASIIPGNMQNSDALFNIGFAFAASQLLPHGVYVTMNGKVFSWDNVRKNLETGYFEKER